MLQCVVAEAAAGRKLLLNRHALLSTSHAAKYQCMLHVYANQGLITSCQGSSLQGQTLVPPPPSAVPCKRVCSSAHSLVWQSLHGTDEERWALAYTTGTGAATEKVAVRKLLT